MTKAELIDLVQEIGSYEHKTDANKAVSAVFEAVVAGLVKKETITIPSFGTFKTAEVGEKKGTVPGTTKKYVSAAHTAPKFKFSKVVKEKMNA